MWYFYSPKIIFGQDSLDHLEKVKGNKVFIVTDPGIIEVKLLDILTDKLKEYGKEWKVFSEVEPDPKEETILKGAKICQDYEPDLIIGLGGGSSLDTAKGIWILYERPDLEIDDMHPFMDLELGKKAEMVAIPTTSGTGAETTWAIIITRNRNGTEIKLEQANKAVIPTYAIIDPVFTKKMPPKLTAMTGFDAVAHTLEGLISTWRNDFSDGMAIKAMELILKYLPIAYENGDDEEAREKMHNAATMAGLAFGNSQVVMGHAMGHVLGATFHIPHGLTVGLFLPYILQYTINDPENDEIKHILAKFAKMTGMADWQDSIEDANKKLIETVKGLQVKVGLPQTLKDLNIDKEKLDEKVDMMSSQCLESSSSVMSPRAADSSTFKKLFMYAYEGKDVDF